MKKLMLSLCFLWLFTGYLFAAAPTRPNTYTGGAVIDPTAVTQNETTIYTYLQSGVDTYANGSITNTAISASAGIPYSKLNLTGTIVDGDIVSITSANKVATESIYGTGIPVSVLATGTPTATTAIYGDGTWKPASYNVLGAWQTRLADTVYIANADAKFCVGYEVAATSKGFFVKTDSSNPPTTVICPLLGSGTGTPAGGCCIPVRKGDYYLATETGGGSFSATYLNFITTGN